MTTKASTGDSHKYKMSAIKITIINIYIYIVLIISLIKEAGEADWSITCISKEHIQEQNNFGWRAK